MFDMGMWEIVLIFVILLIVVGPERLPKLARTLGLWVSKARSMVASVRSEVERELRVEELRQSIKEQTESEQFRKLTDEVKSFGDDMRGVERNMRSSIDRGATGVGNSIRTGSDSDTGGKSPSGDASAEKSPPTDAGSSSGVRAPAVQPEKTNDGTAARSTATTSAERGSE
jgi:sec-independent protein translocase protein TatB